MKPVEHILRLLVLCLVAAGGLTCTQYGPRGESRKVTLYCAAGISPAMDEIILLFQSRTGIVVEPDYDGSGALFARIKLAQRGDLYLPSESGWDLSAYEAVEFDLYLPEGLSGRSFDIKITEDSGRRWRFPLPAEWLAQTGWNHVSLTFNGMWVEAGAAGPTDFRDMVSRRIVSVGVVAMGEAGQTGSFALRNLGMRRFATRVPLGTNPWNMF